MLYKIVRLRKGRKGIVRGRHPWIYKNQFVKHDASIKPGEIVSIVDSEGKFLGRGYFNPRSEISARIITFNDEDVNSELIYNRIAAAFEKRKDILARTNAVRAVFSEADCLPGLIMDIYNDTAVFQILTLGMEAFRDTVIKAAGAVLKAKYIFEKSDSPFRRREGLKEAKRWWGESGCPVVEISEGSVKFLVDIENGHKTGFYLDQRKSRMAIGQFAKGRKVLDLFCYTGGFAVSAAAAGAESVLGVDIKEEWLNLARRNADLNGASERSKFLKGDAFSILKNIYQSGEKFGIIILDPPSFLKTRESLESASKGYAQLNTLAMNALEKDGVLATFSCSHNMPSDRFSEILKRSSEESKRLFSILKRCHQSEDHPIVREVPETEYLKGYFLKIL